MDRMLTDPAKFRPGGGETTSELFKRSQKAWRAIPPGPLIVVVAHGGPIACVRAMLAGATLSELAGYRIAEGKSVWLDRTVALERSFQ